MAGHPAMAAYSATLRPYQSLCRLWCVPMAAYSAAWGRMSHWADYDVYQWQHTVRPEVVSATGQTMMCTNGSIQYVPEAISVTGQTMMYTNGSIQCGPEVVSATGQTMMCTNGSIQCGQPLGSLWCVSMAVYGAALRSYQLLGRIQCDSLTRPAVTVTSNHLQGPHRESPKAMRKLSDTLIDGHQGQRCYQSRKKKSYLINCTLSVTHEVAYPKKNTYLIIIHTNLAHFRVI